MLQEIDPQFAPTQIDGTDGIDTNQKRVLAFRPPLCGRLPASRAIPAVCPSAAPAAGHACRRPPKGVTSAQENITRRICGVTSCAETTVTS